ncbi:MAG TPA: DUF1553 domain-containing protein [Pirellulales bacterium]|nr:DUF1553 domain-containing protein [Pirellulales bacterium]
MSSHAPLRKITNWRLAFSATLALTIIYSTASAADRYSELVLEDKPVGYWRLEKAEDGRVLNEVELPDSTVSLVGAITGEVRLASSGPQAGEFPLFAPDNAAAEFAADGGFIRVKDPGAGSPLDFANGDAITLEAWVSPQATGAGRFLYIIGKGRTETSGRLAVNQNYALRLKTLPGDKAALSFLFHSADEPAANEKTDGKASDSKAENDKSDAKPAFKKGDWHRWTSAGSLAIGDGWHHVAVTYEFGKPKSIKGYIDGESVSGTWDMGGATERAPEVDDDELWIGSSLGGQPASSFRGLLDEVALYRQALPATRIEARYRYTAPLPEFAADRVQPDSVLVDIYENLPDKKSWRFSAIERTGSFTAPAMALVDVPNKYSPRGVKADRSSPFLVRAMARLTIPAGPRRLLIRCRNASRLYLDGKKVLETPFFGISASGHGKVVPLDDNLAPDIRPLQRGDSQQYIEIEGDGREHEFIFEAIVGGLNHRPELGETSVSLAAPGKGFEILSPLQSVPLTDAGWEGYFASEQVRLVALNAEARREASRDEDKYWQARHEWARAELARRAPLKTPELPVDTPAANDIDRFILDKLLAAGRQPGPLCDDSAFLRRVSLDVIGTIPTPEQIEQFASERDLPDRRALLIERLLADPGWADNWVGYWQDLLAENPNLINPTLSNTGPFRWWIHESFLDNKPFDRFATELVMMEGSKYFGGPAGFELSTQDDAPMAVKARIVSQAFLGVEMKCARCHDDPYHEYLQQDLFSVAAMLRRSPQEVPVTSTIPGGDEAVKSLLVEVTLKPGQKIAPEWPFAELSRDDFPTEVLRKADDHRERLAALITSPHNERFAQVAVNRLWRRYLGYGLVEPVDDWEVAKPSHPELLDYLAREFIGHGYDLKYVARLILNSQTYQRVPQDRPAPEAGQAELFATPLVRRMSAEQIVDSLFLAAGKPLRAGPINIDIDGARPHTSSLNLGVATRAWHFTSLSNERDRPSLALPEAQPFVTLMEAFGWRGSRQDPVSIRSQEPAVLQPAIMANGVLTSRVTCLSDDSALTELALTDQPLAQLIDRTYQRLLSRSPTADEQARWTELLKDGYAERRLEAPCVERKPVRELVGWSNHLAPEANVFKAELEKLVSQGDPPTQRLQTDWRERMEDMLWTLVNSPEWVCLP